MENNTPTVFDSVLDVTAEHHKGDTDRNKIYGYLNNKKFNWKKEITLTPVQIFQITILVYNVAYIMMTFIFFVVGACQDISNNSNVFILNDVFFVYTKSYKWELIKQINLNSILPYTQPIYTNIEQSTGQNLYDINIYKNKILIGTNSDINNVTNQASFVYAFTIDVGNKYLSKKILK